MARRQHTFRPYIREWRELLGLNQVQLAERFGLKPSAINRWELGRRGVPLYRLPEIAAALGLPEHQWLFRHPNEMSIDEILGKGADDIAALILAQRKKEKT